MTASLLMGAIEFNCLRGKFCGALSPGVIDIGFEPIVRHVHLAQAGENLLGAVVILIFN